MHRLEECIQVGKGEHSNKEPGACQYAQGRLIMVSWAGSDKMEVTVVEDLCEGVVREDLEIADRDQPAGSLTCQAETGLYPLGGGVVLILRLSPVPSDRY